MPVFQVKQVIMLARAMARQNNLFNLKTDIFWTKFVLWHLEISTANFKI
jgi:hypothetical protein